MVPKFRNPKPHTEPKPHEWLFLCLSEFESIQVDISMK